MSTKNNIQKQIISAINDELKTIGATTNELNDIIANELDLRSGVASIFKSLVIKNQKIGLSIASFEFMVSNDYNHDTWLNENVQKMSQSKSLHYYGNDLNSKNLKKATHKFIPGKKYKVDIHPVFKTVSIEECIAFLSKKKSIFVGAQGLVLLQSINPHIFPVHKYIISLDKKNKLWKNKSKEYSILRMQGYSSGSWRFSFFPYGEDITNIYCLLSFSEVES